MSTYEEKRSILIARRRSADTAYLRLLAVIIMGAPTQSTKYTYRYVILAVALACMAAAFACRQPGDA